MSILKSTLKCRTLTQTLCRVLCIKFVFYIHYYKWLKRENLTETWMVFWNLQIFLYLFFFLLSQGFDIWFSAKHKTYAKKTYILTCMSQHALIHFIYSVILSLRKVLLVTKRSQSRSLTLVPTALKPSSLLDESNEVTLYGRITKLSNEKSIHRKIELK